ncbi:MAG TPA: helix-turn-helix domain-containing protein [Gammaproteobacteria bacterium]|jgi:sugar-specific transcriptional regulator TrmB|nr:helix-turn-helix domain-containing protein [Gammaproteobacteria bacterium]
MAEQQTAETTQSLGILGISEPEERVYRWLLSHAGATAYDVARALSITSRKSRQLLDVIEAKGLATHSPERPWRYLPSAPDIALGALFHQQQKALLGTQTVIQRLQEQANSSQRGDEQEQMVELITSNEAERQLLEQMERTVEHEFITLMRTPMRVTQYDVPAEQYNNRTQREAQARGVRYRSVIDSELLGTPGYLAGVRADMKAGEEVRVTADLPLKLVLADRRLALIPLNLRKLGSPALLVRSSTLLDALYELFEMFWERAAPISFAQAGELQVDSSESELNEETNELISLLAAGLNDKTIAYDLDISKRTFERRIAELMRILNARTRFQTGWLAALRLAGVEHLTDSAKRGKINKTA